MAALISPLSPTSSPLRSARNFLREVLDELRKNCAPARDAEIDDVLSSLLSSSSPSSTYPEANLPSAIIRTIRSIFSLVQEMTDDLHHFALSNLTEPEIARLVTLEARRREIELVARLYGGQTGVRRTWTEWLSSFREEERAFEDQNQSQTTRWETRLLQSLGSPTAISVVPPPMTELPPEVGAVPPIEPSFPSHRNPANLLPASFLIPSPTLFRIQNLLQVLVITACLRLLAYPNSSGSGQAPPTPRSSIPSSSLTPTSFHHLSPNTSPTNPREAYPNDNAALDLADVFASRILTLLVAEIDRDPRGLSDAETKLVNLEDEVWNVIQLRGTQAHGFPVGRTGGGAVNSSQEPNEASIRANVRRLLRAEDPVFALFMRRVIGALDQWFTTNNDHKKDYIGAQSQADMKVRPTYPQALPSRMQTGQMQDPNFLYTHYQPHPLALPLIKGFESKALHQSLETVVLQVQVVLDWVQITWGDILIPLT